MHVAFLNPQGNFDPADRYWTEHPDFGGQLVYVKQVALAMGTQGHQVDIITRRIVDPQWPEFAEPFDAYPDAPHVRIIRLPAGPDYFLRKELLWPHLVKDWVPNIIAFYQQEGQLPDCFSAHYGDGGLCGVLLKEQTGIPFSFTAHSLGAQKMDKLGISVEKLPGIEDYFYFRRRLMAERLSMNRSLVNITSTDQERFVQYSHNAYRGAVDWTDDRRFAVIPPGVNLDIFDRDGRMVGEDRIRDHFQDKLARDIKQERLDFPCIIASSRLDPKKNHLGLVQAYASSTKLRQKANLVILTGNLDDPLNGFEDAKDPEKEVLEDLQRVIEEADLRGLVSMFSVQGQEMLAAAYRFFAERRSVFALTALYEPFGLAPLEAMASGLPAVVTKFGGPSESMLEGDEEYGLLVDPADLDQVSTALLRLISDPDQWEAYSQAGYRRVLSRYIWQRTAEGYLDALQRPAAAPPPRTRLPIHPFFQDPKDAHDITLAELKALYLEYELLGVGETLVEFIAASSSASLRTAEEFHRFLGGQAANVAVYASLLGARSAVLSMVGADPFGEFLEESLQRCGVSTTHLLKTALFPTTSVFAATTSGGLDFQANRGADAQLSIHDIPEELINLARIVHTSCFALSREPSRSAVSRALQLAKKHHKTVSLVLNYSPRTWPDKDEVWEVLAQVLPYVTVVKSSLEDARLLMDPNLDERELETAALEGFHELGAGVVVITRSSGMVTVSDGNTVERIGPLPLVTADSTIGGSDAFWAGMLVAHLDGKSWKEAVCFAHQVAAIKPQSVGHATHLIDKEALYHLVDKQQDC